jgi:myo-inositol-1(or 4)-monophosphatase
MAEPLDNEAERPLGVRRRFGPSDLTTARRGYLLLEAEHAVELGAHALRRGRAHIGSLIPKGDRDFATDVDFQIEIAIKGYLADATPNIPFLGEEEGGSMDLVHPRWVLDPIDGTINFARQSPFCAISLSLVTAGQPILGIVDAPFLDEHYVAQQGSGAYLNGQRIRVSPVESIREAIVGVADFKVGIGSDEENRVHLALLRRLAHRALRVRMLGSAALDLAWLAVGRLNATMMLSNLPWDVTAGLLLVREAGGVAYDFDGTEHGVRSRYTLASEPSLRAAITEVVREAM